MRLDLKVERMSKVFFNNEILGIDIGTMNIKVVHVRKKSKNQLKVINYGIGKTPEGCIKNGVISDFAILADNIRGLIEEQKISEKKVKILISASSEIISKVIFVSCVEGKKSEEIIKVEVGRQIPVDINEQKLFYRITGDMENSKGQMLRVLVTLVPNRIIENYVKLLKQLGLTPVSIEIPYSSMARFFSKGVRILDRNNIYRSERLIDIDKGATLIADIGFETTNLSILNGGSLEFSRVILMGGRALDEFIAARLGVKCDDAERYKKMHGISGERHRGDEIAEIVEECSREYIDEVLVNIKRSMDFYIERCGGETVQRVLFIGGLSGMKGLKQYAQDFLGIDSYTVDLMSFANVEYDKSLDMEKTRFLINALGIAI